MFYVFIFLFIYLKEGAAMSTLILTSLLFDMWDIPLRHSLQDCGLAETTGLALRTPGADLMLALLALLLCNAISAGCGMWGGCPAVQSEALESIILSLQMSSD